MISITTPILDPNGELIFKEDNSTDFGSYKRRIQSTVTLDIGVSVEDLGYSDLDRKVTITLPATKSIHEALLYLMSNYAELNMSTRTGFNTMGIATMSMSSGKIKLACELIS